MLLFARMLSGKVLADHIPPVRHQTRNTKILPNFLLRHSIPSIIVTLSLVTCNLSLAPIPLLDQSFL